jgi:sucrose phosphorylase
MIPETFEFISGLAEKAHVLGMEVLVEMHGHYEDQIQLASRVGLRLRSSAADSARAVRA